MSELRDIFSQGNAELQNTAGEDAFLVRRSTRQRVPVRAVISPAELVLELPSVNGGKLVCDRTVLLSAEGKVRRPDLGDFIEADGKTYEVLRVTGWAYGASWMLDVGLRGQRDAAPFR